MPDYTLTITVRGVTEEELPSIGAQLDLANDHHTLLNCEIDSVRPASPVGGLDGVEISFGDGCDGGTFASIFAEIGGWVAELRWKDGTSCTATVTDWQIYDGNEQHVLFDKLDDDGGTAEPNLRRPVAELVGVHIF